MFYSAEMLTKRGPLARVWMASHLSTKLTKSNLLSTSIPASVTSILGEALLPMALRLSGQLLLGVARIYSRKAKYLLDDCNETLVRVKRAFRPGGVDMDESGEGRSREAVTLRAENGGLDDILNYEGNYWDMDFAAPIVAGPSKARVTGKNVSNLADITLPDYSLAHYDDLPQFDYGEAGPIGGDDFEFDLGLDDEIMDIELGVGEGSRKRARSEGDESIEMGRDAVGSDARRSVRGDSIGSRLSLGLDKESLGVVGEEGEERQKVVMDDMDVDMGGMEFGEFDFGDIGNGGGEQDGRGATPQQGDVDESLGLTPRTAADLVAKTAKKDGPSPAKKQKLKKALVDKSIELDWSKEKGSKQDKENLFTEAHYLPSSRLHLRLLELNAAPVSHQLPTAHPLSPDYFLVAPPGIAPELAQLFKFPSRRAKIAAAGAERAPEVGRGVAARESVAGDAVLEEFDFGDFGNGGGEQGGEFDYGDDQGYIPDQAHFEIVEMDDVAADAVAPITASQKKKGKAVERDDFSIGGGGDSTGLLAVFDSSSSMAFSATQQTQTQTQSLGAEEEETGKEGAWSKNTFKALGVLRSQLVEKDEVTVADIAVGATKKAAAAFFFELLVLGSKNVIKLQQGDAYGSIVVKARDGLFDGVEVEV